MTYDLRRLRLHGLIQRVQRTNRYMVTEEGLRVALFFTRAHARFFRVALAYEGQSISGRAARYLIQAQKAVDRLADQLKLAA